MKNILQSGLAIGIPSGCCSCHNMNFNWLYSDPANILWVDKVIITQTMWDIIMDCMCTTTIGEGKEVPFSKSTKLIYTILRESGLVEIIPDDSINKETRDEILDLIASDIEMLGNNVSEEDTILRIGEYCHCVPSLWTLYASLYLSWKNNASFMLEEREIAYLKQILPLRMPDRFQDISIGRIPSAINEVLRITLPKLKLGHGYLSDSTEHCNSCANVCKCKDGYLKEIEKQVFTLLGYRNREEVRQLCELMNKICSEWFKKGYELDSTALLHEINVERIKVQQKLNSSFKTIEKWKNIVMTISAGMTLSAFFSHPLLAEIGATGVLASEVANSLIEHKEKQYSWINLFNEA